VRLTTALGFFFVVVVGMRRSRASTGGLRLDNSGNCLLRAESTLRAVGQSKLLKLQREGTPAGPTMIIFGL
jgi:hypothetical protein